MSHIKVIMYVNLRLVRLKLNPLISWWPVSYARSPPAGKLVSAVLFRLPLGNCPGHRPATRTGVSHVLPGPSRQMPELCLRLGHLGHRPFPIRYSLSVNRSVGCSTDSGLTQIANKKWVNFSCLSRNPKVNYHIHMNPSPPSSGPWIYSTVFLRCILVLSYHLNIVHLPCIS